MGSRGPADLAALSEEDEGDGDEIVVMVTGFGPFKVQFPINPSWEITRTLPRFITPNPTAAAAASSTPPPRQPKIRLIKYPAPIRVSYAVVRELVPQLWDGGIPGDDGQDDEMHDAGEGGGEERRDSAKKPQDPRPKKKKKKIDLMIHIGMAGGRDFYSIERRARRDGYRMADVDGAIPRDEQKEGWIWADHPPELKSSFDLDDVWRRWRSALPAHVDVRPSNDAGSYLCEFLYYSSLAHLWEGAELRRVVFLHVPVETDDVAVARGREVVIELIRAIVQSEKMIRGGRGGLRSEWDLEG